MFCALLILYFFAADMLYAYIKHQRGVSADGDFRIDHILIEIILHGKAMKYLRISNPFTQ